MAPEPAAAAADVKTETRIPAPVLAAASAATPPKKVFKEEETEVTIHKAPSSLEDSPVLVAADKQPGGSTSVPPADARTAAAAAKDPELAAALQRQRDRDFEEPKLICSLENKEACIVCSG
jgi:ribonucleoside-diphosphate reductase subunit M1